MRIVSGGSLLQTLMAIVIVVQLVSSFAGATYLPPKSVITLTGIGAAPSCPGGWTEIVAQTAAGTFQAVTSVNTTTISPLTSCSTGSAYENGHGNFLLTTGGGGNQTFTTGCSTSNYGLVSGVNLTTYTKYYRVCEK
ncbi:MAG: hypothetical protein HY553_13990 [Elusimicrobia bacterium]|nr:hypothetical protein [Elusimicrobiota bacterium]